MNDAEALHDMRAASATPFIAVASDMLAKLLAIAGYDGMATYCAMLAGRRELVKIRRSDLIELLVEARVKISTARH